MVESTLDLMVVVVVEVIMAEVPGVLGAEEGLLILHF
jgi:hypothetical protein